MTDEPLKAYQLRDEDYELVDGHGWFKTGKFSVRIGQMYDGSVFVDVYADGHEVETVLGSVVVGVEAADEVVRQAALEEAEHGTPADA